MSPGLLDGTSYFKSMDGHRNAWDFSLIRLNLHVARMAAGAGGVILVDCTGNRRKRFPDSMSKTVPIWCAVLQAAMDEAVEFDDLLHLPSDVKEERLEILKRMPQWVEMLRQALPAAELKDLAQQLYGKRLRACWVCPSDDLEQMSADLKNLEKDFVLILCVSVSKVEMGSTSYVQGAGDDEEAWAQQLGLTPELFWKHVDELMAVAHSKPEEVDDLIRSLAVQRVVATATAEGEGVCSQIAATGLCVGDFQAAQPPMVWKDRGIDAVLNCGGEEHPEMKGDKRYLFLPAADEKKHDPTKHWWPDVLLPRALRFLARHLQEGRRVLIHCTRGDNRSPAVAVAALAAFYGPKGLDPFSVAGCRLEKSDLRRCLVTVQCYHPHCMVPRRIMQFLNLFFVTEGAGWSHWRPDEEDPALPDLAPKTGAMSAGPARGGLQADEVQPGMWISGRHVANSLPLLRQLKITHILNATKEPNLFEDEFTYHQMPIEDSRCENLLDALEPALAFLHETRTGNFSSGSDGARILIHCREGVSRSVAVVVAYLMRFQNFSLDSALELLRERRNSLCQPNASFMRQLRSFEAEEKGQSN